MGERLDTPQGSPHNFGPGGANWENQHLGGGDKPKFPRWKTIVSVVYENIYFLDFCVISFRFFEHPHPHLEKAKR